MELLIVEHIPVVLYTSLFKMIFQVNEGVRVVRDGSREKDLKFNEFCINYVWRHCINKY